MLGKNNGWLSEIAAHVRRQYFVNRLELLSDHALQDIGLRRDQLDALRLPPQQDAAPRSRARLRAAVRPSLQGCG